MSSDSADRGALETALAGALRETTGRSVLFSEAVATRAGMNQTDLEALDILVRHGPMTAGRLAELSGLTTGAITGLVDRLERRGHVRREPHPTDRRSVVVRPLTETAERDLAPSYAAMDEAMATLFARYSDAELAILVDFMTRAAAVTGDVIARLQSDAPASRVGSPRR